MVIVDHDFDAPALPAMPGCSCAAGLAIGIPDEDVESGKFGVLGFSRHLSVSFFFITLSGDASRSPGAGRGVIQ